MYKLKSDRENEDFADEIHGVLDGLFLVQWADFDIGGVAVDSPLHLSRDLVVSLIPSKKANTQKHISHFSNSMERERET